MTLDPRQLAEQLIRSAAADIDTTGIGEYIDDHHPEVPLAEFDKLVGEVDDLLAKGDWTIVFAEDGE